MLPTSPRLRVYEEPGSAVHTHGASKGGVPIGLLQPLPNFPQGAPLCRLDRATKASLGHKDNRHNSCIRCWATSSYQHRVNWRYCPNACPQCPAHQQHRGQACPHLLRDSNDEWWLAHCGHRKPSDPCDPPPGSSSEFPEPSASATRADSPLVKQALDPLGDVRRRGRGHSRTPASHQNVTDKRDCRRSRSPSSQRECEGREQYRVRELPPRPEPMTRKQKNRERSHTYQACSMETKYEMSNAEWDAAMSQLNAQRREVRQTPQPASGDAKAPDCSADSQARPLWMNAKAADADCAIDGCSGTHAQSAPVSTARPQALVWSDGSVTAATVRELVRHDPWISMVIHQTVKFADFFSRHPEASRGEELVSVGMRLYLEEIRTAQPEYLSTSGTPGRFAAGDGAQSRK